jgi:hypothetical protein
MCRRIGHLELSLVGCNLVDDVSVRGGQRAQGPIAALVAVRRISLGDEAPAGCLRGNHQILFSRANFGAERGDQAVAQISALEQQRELLVNRAVE